MSKSVGTGLDCGLGYLPELSVTHSDTVVAVCSSWRYISVTPVPSPVVSFAFFL